MNRLLVAVDDSAPALAAARLAIDLAVATGCHLSFVAVREPTDHPHIERVLAHVGELADEAGLDATTELVVGSPPFEVLLAAARRADADLIVMGRSDTRRPGVRHVGGQTEHVLEFTELPVLVVPGSARSA